MKWPRQAFRLPADIMKAVSRTEVEATFGALQALDLARPPFPEFDVMLPASDVIRVTDPTFKHYSQDANTMLKDQPCIVRFEGARCVGIFLEGRPGNWMEIRQFMNADCVPALRQGGLAVGCPEGVSLEVWMNVVEESIGDDIYSLLLTLLATKNTEKTVEVNKLARLRIGDYKRQHHYVTTIRVGHVTESEGESSRVESSVPRRPHLRRGHIRQQAYGPNFSYHRAIFIEPIFVNADEGWITERVAYNVSRS